MNNGAERVNREVDLAVNVSEVRKLDSDGFVHRSEVEGSIGVDAILIQCVLGSGQPFIASWPPQSMV